MSKVKVITKDSTGLVTLENFGKVDFTDPRSLTHTPVTDEEFVDGMMMSVEIDWEGIKYVQFVSHHDKFRITKRVDEIFEDIELPVTVTTDTIIPVPLTSMLFRIELHLTNGTITNLDMERIDISRNSNLWGQRSKSVYVEVDTFDKLQTIFTRNGQHGKLIPLLENDDIRSLETNFLVDAFPEITLDSGNVDFITVSCTGGFSGGMVLVIAKSAEYVNPTIVEKYLTNNMSYVITEFVDSSMYDDCILIPMTGPGTTVRYWFDGELVTEKNLDDVHEALTDYMELKQDIENPQRR